MATTVVLVVPLDPKAEVLAGRPPVERAEVVVDLTLLSPGVRQRLVAYSQVRDGRLLLNGGRYDQWDERRRAWVSWTVPATVPKPTLAGVLDWLRAAETSRTNAERALDAALADGRDAADGGKEGEA